MSRHSINGARWRRVAASVKERDGYACADCGATDRLSVDHVKPVALFTEQDWVEERQYDPRYLVTRCLLCNNRKGTKLETRGNWLNPRWLGGALFLGPVEDTGQPPLFAQKQSGYSGL